MLKQLLTIALFVAIGGSLVVLVLKKASVINPIPITLEESPATNITPSPEPAEPEKIVFLFGGDMMWDRHIRKFATQSSYDFILEKLTQSFMEADVVVANLEGPITDNNSVSLGSAVGSTNNFIFTFDPQVAPTLYKNNIRIVNLGNNHILNMGRDGVAQTEKYLEEASIEYFGNTGDLVRDTQKGMLKKNINGVDFLFVNYNEFTQDDPQVIKKWISQERPNVDLVILYTHWGAEYQPTSNQVITDLAHSFIDSGVDLIIGSHPHVIQQSEVYKGKTIYYSLGNFVFDQYFSPETMTGLLVKAEIDPETLEMAFSEQEVITEKTGQTVLKAN